MLVKVPFLIESIFPNRIWRRAPDEDQIYLTFDDGPVPGITPWVLDELAKFNAKATFFCIGDNVRKYPGIFERIISEGHYIGNHTQNHLNGWRTTTQEYVENVLLAEQSFSKFLAKKDTKEFRLFRPPYGRLTGYQAKKLRQKNFRIVMWEVLSRDYSPRISPDTCFENVVKHADVGSIIVFHDSFKAEKNLKVVLPKVLQYFISKGFEFKGLET